MIENEKKKKKKKKKKPSQLNYIVALPGWSRDFSGNSAMKERAQLFIVTKTIARDFTSKLQTTVGTLQLLTPYSTVTTDPEFECSDIATTAGVQWKLPRYLMASCVLPSIDR